MALDADQRAALVGAALRGHLRERQPEACEHVVAFPGGAAACHQRRGWVLLDERPGDGLGRALAWSLQRGAERIDVIAGRDADVLARRAALFAVDVAVWEQRGRDLVPAVAAPVPATIEPGPEALDAAGVLVDAGVEVVIEHGVVRGEVLGLEVARVVVDDLGARVEVGVGRHDREAFAQLHGHLPEAAAVAAVVAAVREHRAPGRSGHPLHRLARERWLRRVLVERPELVGVTHLEPVEGTRPVESVQQIAPAMAVGVDSTGTTVVVACSVGIDLELVPAAADAAAVHAPEGRITLALPVRDDHRVTRRLAESLATSAQVVALGPDAGLPFDLA